MGVHQDGPVAVVPRQPEQSGLAGAEIGTPIRQLGQRLSGSLGDRVEQLSHRREPRLDPEGAGMDRAGHHPRDSRDRARRRRDCHDAGRAADHVDDVTLGDPGTDRVPMGIESADRDRDSRREAESLGPCGGELAGQRGRGRVPSSEQATRLTEEGIDRGEERVRREAAVLGAPEPLVTHGADASGQRFEVGDSAEHRGNHVAMLQRRHGFLPPGRVVPEPMEQLGEPPLR